MRQPRYSPYQLPLPTPVGVVLSPSSSGVRIRYPRPHLSRREAAALRAQYMKLQDGRCFRYDRSPRCLYDRSIDRRGKEPPRLSLHFPTLVALRGVDPGEPVLLCDTCRRSAEDDEERERQLGPCGCSWTRPLPWGMSK